MTVAETRGGDHTVGPADAPVTLVEYGDYQCPYCAGARTVLEELVEQAAGKMRLVFRHYPLDSVHPLARRAAEAAEAAGAQGRFWPYHRRLLAADDLSDEALLALARAEGLDADRIANELREGGHAETVRADKQAGRELPLKRTPTFVSRGEPWDGFYDLETLSELIA